LIKYGPAKESDEPQLQSLSRGQIDEVRENLPLIFVAEGDDGLVGILCCESGEGPIAAVSLRENERTLGWLALEAVVEALHRAARLLPGVNPAEVTMEWDAEGKRRGRLFLAHPLPDPGVPIALTYIAGGVTIEGPGDPFTDLPRRD
jgi:hypothetical protein